MPHESRSAQTAHTSSSAAAHNHSSSGISRPAIQLYPRAPAEKEYADNDAFQVDDRRASEVKAFSIAAVNGGDQAEAADIKPFQLKPADAKVPYNAGNLSQQGNTVKEQAPVQRQYQAFQTSSGRKDLIDNYQDAVLAAVQEIDRHVDNARSISLNWGHLLEDDRPHVRNWANTAMAYFNNPENVPKFLHAEFGYAIETIACASIPSPLNGLRVDFQVASGHTRPDIVLISPEGEELAWIDITSSASIGHILGKTGAGWSSRPFVFEILYEPLQLNSVLQGMQDPVYKAYGEYLGVKNQVKYEEEETQTTILRNSLIELQQHNEWSTGEEDASDKRNITRSHLQDMGMDLGRSHMKATRGALAATGIYDGPYGFNRGDIGTDSGPAKQYIGNRAKPAIEERHRAIDESYRQEYVHIMASREELPFVRHFRAILADNGQPVVELWTAVAVAVQQYNSLNEALEAVRAQAPGNEMGPLINEMENRMNNVPGEADFGLLRAWCNEVAGLISHLLI